ncbi:Uncharacterised protein [Escherichia coli]|nr:Uncharacterised protein [Escherichia coli]CTW81822.1 Uncharacterised protein [Escherichia coli]
MRFVFCRSSIYHTLKLTVWVFKPDNPLIHISKIHYKVCHNRGE